MDIHWFSIGQALPKDLVIKDMSLAKSFQDKLRTCWIVSHLCLSPVCTRFLTPTCKGPNSLAWYGKVLHKLAPNHVSSFDSCYYFLQRNPCSGIDSRCLNIPGSLTFLYLSACVPFVWNASIFPCRPANPYSVFQTWHECHFLWESGH